MARYQFPNGHIPWNRKEKIKIICQICKKELFVIPFLANPPLSYKVNKKKYCSRKCQGIAHSKMRGEQAPNWKGGKPRCIDCDKSISYSSINHRYKRCRLCNQKFLKGINAGHWKGGMKKLTCSNCGKIRYIIPSYVPKTSYCLKCMPKFLKPTKGLKRLYLSEYNKTHIRSKEQASNWQGGISRLPYSFDFNRQLKDKIRVRDNFICQLCGVPELECNHRLSIHHIDYDKLNCQNNNLLSLCKGCNAKVNYNREKWKKYFYKKMEEKNGSERYGNLV